VYPADAPLRVAALRERSGVGFSAWFTLARKMDEKRIERVSVGVSSSKVSRKILFFTM
jgi:hypothetical protein